MVTVCLEIPGVGDFRFILTSEFDVAQIDGLPVEIVLTKRKTRKSPHKTKESKTLFLLELISFHQADGTNVFITKELDGSQIDGILVEVLEAKNLEKRRNVYVDAVLEGQTLSTGVCDDMPLPKWGGEGLVLNVRSDWSELICIVLSKVRDLVCMSVCVLTCVRTCLRACVLLVLFVVLRVRSDCGEQIRNVL